MSEEDEIAKLLAGSSGGLKSLIPDNLGGEDAIKHAEDAVDFEGEDELADDDDQDDHDLFGSGDDDLLGGDDAGEAADGGDDDDMNDWTKSFAAELTGAADSDTAMAELDEGDESPDAEEEPPVAPEVDQEEVNRQLLKMYYPEFEPYRILKMNTLFSPKPAELSLSQPRIVRPCLPNQLRLDVEPDYRNMFKSAAMRAPVCPGVVHIEAKELPEITDSATASDESETQEQTALESAAADWDRLLEIGEDANEDVAMKDVNPQDINIYLDELYDSDDERAILDGSYELAKPKVQINMNDPHLLFVNHRGVGPVLSRHTSLQSRYNISNDQAYDLLKENYQNKVRSTIGNLNIDHSLVALRLQSPFYKVRLSKAQTRSWHRPKFNVKPGQSITFLPLKSRKKKKDKGKPITQLLAKSSDLTLGDNAPIFFIEYGEEFPLVLSNVGMGSKLINYYRKKSPEDANRPKMPIGETHVLDVQDRSAFWNFGFVEPGNVVPTLYNQLIRAPVFRHEPRKTDFLLIRSTTKARGQRYFLRQIPYLFVAGQTFPVTLIPGPHSRKVTTASKNRLKMIVYRVLNKDSNQRLQVRDISAHFPDQNDMQNRQRLKEFMEYQRSGKDQGFWKVKQGKSLPNEESIRNMIAPEDIALLEAMQVGQQHLEDSGYGKTVDDDRDDQDGMSLEEQLAPWNISRNFINAIQGKAMLQLHGDGDPTARGEGFSFLRTSMKGGFKAANEDKVDKSKLGGHSYNVAMQQRAYDEEIKRVWYAQAKSLRITDPRQLPAEKHPREDTPASEEDMDGTGGQNVLRIVRMYKDENDVLQRKTEVVTDPNVIRAYVKRRQGLEDAQRAPDKISVTEDVQLNRRNRKILEEELARLQRNKDRRNARKATKGDSKTGQKVKLTTRKCATCGAVGHIRTNKSCPMYNDIYTGEDQAKNDANIAVPVPQLP